MSYRRLQPLQRLLLEEVGQRLEQVSKSEDNNQVLRLHNDAHDAADVRVQSHFRPCALVADQATQLLGNFAKNGSTPVHYAQTVYGPETGEEALRESRYFVTNAGVA